MTPFWLMLIGVGIIWFIGSGAATRILGAVFGQGASVGEH